MAWIIVIAVAFVGYHLSLRWKVASMYRSARNAGFPTTLQELDASYSLPPGVANAAAEVLKAGELLKGLEPPERHRAEMDALKQRADRENWDPETFQAQMDEAGDAWDPAEEYRKKEDIFRDIPPDLLSLPEEWRDMIAAYLAERAEAIDRLRRAAAIGTCRYPVDFTKWFDGCDLTVHLKVVRDGVCLFQRDAILKSDREDTAGAVESLGCAIRLAATLNKEPTIMSQLTRSACFKSVFEGLEYVLSRRQ